MMNAGNGKPLLPLLILAIILCGAMALGGTMASINYVDKNLEPRETLSPNDNRYRVSLHYYDNGVFSKSLLDEPVFTNNVPWCPGYTEIVYLNVTNNEAFPVECTLNMDVGQSALNSVMEYSLLGSIHPASDGRPTSWGHIENSTEKWTVKKLNKGLHEIFKDLTLQPGQTEYYALAVHMDENATNSHQGKAMSIDFKFSVNANYMPNENPQTVSPR